MSNLVNKQPNKPGVLLLSVHQAAESIVVAIIEQDERFRAEADQKLLKFVASNGFSICSSAYPEIKLSRKALYLRGYMTGNVRDNTFFLEIGDNIEEVEEYIEQLKVAVAEFVNNAPEFQ